MSDEFLRDYAMKAEKRLSKKRIKKNIAAVKSLIEKEDKPMTKRRIKPLIIAAVIAAVSAVLLVTVNAAPKGIPVKFIMGGEEIEGEYIDYVDGDGFRRISFNAVVPLYEQKYAIIYDVDAPQGVNVRVITEETDPEFFENLRLYLEAADKAHEETKAMWDTINAWKGDWDKSNLHTWDEVQREAEQAGIIDPSEVPEFPKPEDFGLVFKDSELCSYSYGHISKTNIGDWESREGNLGGEFMNDYENPKPSGHQSGGGHLDYENGTQELKQSFYYYVGKG